MSDTKQQAIDALAKFSWHSFLGDKKPKSVRRFRDSKPPTVHRCGGLLSRIHPTINPPYGR